MPDRYYIKRTGFINASGTDLIDFINRMSTNDLRKFSENEFRKTVLTTDKGRIIDLISIFNLKVLKFILTSDNFQDKVTAHLDKFIIMDDVILRKPDSQFFLIVISGDVLPLSEKLFAIKPEVNKVYELSENEYLFMDDFKINTLNIICKEDSLDKYKELLKDIHEQSSDEYEYARINAGIPEGEEEFNDNINPMECGLERYISFNKGCYIGQEVIARLDSQGKLPKQMIKIYSEEPLQRNEKIFLHEGKAENKSEEKKEVGFISSTVSKGGDNISLGFIRSINLNYEKEYFTGSSDDPDKNVKIKISIIN